MEYRKISESEVTITELMVPTYTNFGGKVHVGYLLSLRDKVKLNRSPIYEYRWDSVKD